MKLSRFCGKKDVKELSFLIFFVEINEKSRIFCNTVDINFIDVFLTWKIMKSLREKCPNTEFFLVQKYGTEKTAYLDTFHAVVETLWKDMQTNLVTDLVYGVTMGQTVFLADMSINKNDVTNELTSLPNVTSNTKQI